jgi:ribosomal peptide maturation radical SAM protein 1
MLHLLNFQRKCRRQVSGRKRASKTAIAKRPVVLVAPPWALYNRPSVQIGALGAYLRREIPDLAVANHHFFLSLAARLGYATYQAISERSFLAEAVYAALLYPERRPEIEARFQRLAGRHSRLAGLDLTALLEGVRGATDAFLDDIDWGQSLLAGFTVGLCQLTATLYLATRVKARCPELPIVVGGAAMPHSGAVGLTQAFPQIDLVVSGEGERPLAHIVAHLRAGKPLASLPLHMGITNRHAALGALPGVHQVKSLDTLPIPDYDAYFDLLGGLTPGQRFFPVLPVEASRGCWWQKPLGAGRSRGCAFCNLNLQWQGYRAKSARRVAREVDVLTDRHQTLSVAFMDNVLPREGVGALCEALAGLDKDLRLFAEVRAAIRREDLAALRRAGAERLQVGIEALSTSLLKRLGKGTTAIDNLNFMKICEALGLINSANLILHFPGSTDAEVAETLAAIDRAHPYRPLRCVSFWLGLESPVWRNPKAYGLQAVWPHPHLAKLFPESVARRLTFMIHGYRGDRLRQYKRWRPVERRVTAWQRAYARLRPPEAHTPALYLRDGGRFAIIVEHRQTGLPRKHRLTGTSRAIYQFCQRPRSVGRLRAEFDKVAEAELRGFLNMMTDKGLMFADGERFLSLAAPLGWRRLGRGAKGGAA